MIKQQKYLAFLGLVPFIGLSLLIFSDYVLFSFITNNALLKSYTLLIGAFMAGCHWGMLLPPKNNTKTPKFFRILPLISNVLALCFWFAFIFLSDFMFFVMSGIGFLALFILDARLNKYKLITDSYFRLRMTISIQVIVSLLIVAFAIRT